jgi:hypothetical protein
VVRQDELLLACCEAVLITKPGSERLEIEFRRDCLQVCLDVATWIF